MQDLIQAEAPQIYAMIVRERGHFYVCGDCTMAEDVYQTLKQIIQTHGKMADKEVEEYMLSLRVIILRVILFYAIFKIYMCVCNSKQSDVVLHQTIVSRMRIGIMRIYSV